MKNSRKYIPPPSSCLLRRIFFSVARWTLSRVEAPGTPAVVAEHQKQPLASQVSWEAPGWGWQSMHFWRGISWHEQTPVWSYRRKKQVSGVFRSTPVTSVTRQTASSASDFRWQSVRSVAPATVHDSTFSEQQGMSGVFLGDQQRFLARPLASGWLTVLTELGGYECWVWTWINRLD